jgi:hypothetical protein
MCASADYHPQESVKKWVLKLRSQDPQSAETRSNWEWRAFLRSRAAAAVLAGRLFVKTPAAR